MKKLLFTMAMVLLSEWGMAQSAKGAAASGFSFDVYGDSRSMLFLPYREDQQAEARRYLADIYDLMLSEKMAAEEVDKDARLTYDPANHELLQIDTPLQGKRATLTSTKAGLPRLQWRTHNFSLAYGARSSGWKAEIGLPGG